MKMNRYLFGSVFLLTAIVSSSLLKAETLLMTDTGYVYPANKKSSSYFGFKKVVKGQCHLAKDFKASIGAPIYATDDGVVKIANDNITGYNSPAGAGGVIVIEHKTSSGKVFYALYGHIRNFAVKVGDKVSGGQKIAEVAPYSAGGFKLSHLHFGINTSQASLQGFSSSCSDTLGFVDPVKYINENSTVKGSCKAKPDSVNTAENTLIVTPNVLANDSDVDGDALSIISGNITSEKGVSVINHNNGTFTYTPKIDFTGTDSFSYTMTDKKGCTKSSKVTVNVGNNGGSGSGGSSSGGGSTALFSLLLLLGLRLYRKTIISG